MYGFLSEESAISSSFGWLHEQCVLGMMIMIALIVHAVNGVDITEGNEKLTTIFGMLNRNI